MKSLWITCFVLSLLVGGNPTMPSQETARHTHAINTWLLLGTFDNINNAGFERDWIGETTIQPREGDTVAARTWRYFDDRLFSRNYDDYNDLFSYLTVKRRENAAAKVVYAHIYIFCPRATEAQLRLGVDHYAKAWLNGELVATVLESQWRRDSVRANVRLQGGWNRLLLKVANTEEGRLGFYARLCTPDGGPLQGVQYSVNGGQGPLAISTKPMEDIQTGELPIAYREWSYVQADAIASTVTDVLGILKIAPHLAVKASAFYLMAQGGKPPYRWSIAKGSLPKGLRLREDGSIEGTPHPNAKLGDYRLSVRVKDSVGATAIKSLTLRLQERPNRWLEEGRLSALIHVPEGMPAGEHRQFARLMRAQGYALGMCISYNNGDYAYRWRSRFEPNNPLGDVISPYKQALEAEGIRFGMYLGNLDGPNHGGENGAVLLIDEVMRLFNPSAIWFDWAGWQGYALDALYSVIRAHNPNTLIILNGIPTLFNGDWDVVCMEGWGAWGERHWAVWPIPVQWFKRVPVESWRLVTDPHFEYSQGVHPDWREYLKVMLALIGEGYVANIDHSPVIRQRVKSLNDSVVIQCHQRMAQWLNPPGIPALTQSFTQVYPAPLPPADWGYSLVNARGDILYLHITANPRGKSGMPEEGTLTIRALRQRVKRVVWMNRDQELPFSQQADRLSIPLSAVETDPVCTVLKVELHEPLRPPFPAYVPARPAKHTNNLALHKPASLLSADGTRFLPTSGWEAFPSRGVDGDLKTTAQAGNEWAWSYQVDLLKQHRIARVVIHFGRGYATEYRLWLSQDGKSWQLMDSVTGCTGGTREHAFAHTLARYIRVQAVKPDGPDQPGGQMSIAELQVYAR